MSADSTRQLRNSSDRVMQSAVKQILGPSVLLIVSNGTRLVSELLACRPEVRWDIFTLEHFLLTSLCDQLESESAEQLAASIQLHCNPDLPPGLFDTVLLPTSAGGAAELTRDLLQQAVNCIKTNGRLIVSTDNAKDTWLLKQLKTICGRVTVEQHTEGVCYIARRRPQPAKQKDFNAEFAFRDGERLVWCHSRPGVFSHRKLDGGARALVRSLDSLAGRPQPKRIAEIGCGCGAVATAAALRWPQAEVLAVDSHVRAVQSTETTAARNDVTNLTTMLSCHAVLPDEGKWDLYLANPPYYSDYRISELFLQSAAASLRPEGRIHLVTRLTDWHESRMRELFTNIEVRRIGEYDVIIGTS